jgi:hypothetical protein
MGLTVIWVTIREFIAAMEPAISVGATNEYFAALDRIRKQSRLDTMKPTEDPPAGASNDGYIFWEGIDIHSQ